MVHSTGQSGLPWSPHYRDLAPLWLKGEYFPLLYTKAKVEAAVLVVERFILARLRNRRFFSLSELNAAIRESLDELNIRLMRKLGASRREFFETIDQPALLPLPSMVWVVFVQVIKRSFPALAVGAAIF